MIKKLALYSFVLLFPAMAAGEPLALSDVINQAIKQSPEITSLDQQIKSAEAKKRQALAPSDPAVSVNFNDQTSITAPGTAASTTYQISQPVAFPGKAFVNRDIADGQVKQLEAQRRAMQLQVSLNVKQAYLQLALARKNLDLHKQLKGYYEEILDVAKRRYETGGITQVDYLTAKMALYSDENDVKDLQSAEYAARVQLNILLGNQPETFLEVEKLKYEPKADIDPAQADALMLEHRTDIAAGKAQLKMSENSYKLAKMSVLPDFQLVAGTSHYNIETASPYFGDSNRNTTYAVGVQMSIPLWAPLNEKQTIAAASHDKAAAEANLHSTVNQSENALKTAIDNVNNVKAKLDNYEKNLLPLAEQSFRLAMVNYSAGKLEFQALSDAATSWRNLQRDYNAAIVNYLTAYSNYGQLIGEDL